MADVIVILRIFPKTIEIDVEDLEKKVREAISPEKLEREPIAFGLVAIRATKLVPDLEGQVDALEKKLREMEEVGEIEIVGITRSL